MLSGILFGLRDDQVVAKGEDRLGHGAGPGKTVCLRQCQAADGPDGFLGVRLIGSVENPRYRSDIIIDIKIRKALGLIELLIVNACIESLLNIFRDSLGIDDERMSMPRVPEGHKWPVEPIPDIVQIGRSRSANDCLSPVLRLQHPPGHQLVQRRLSQRPAEVVFFALLGVEVAYREEGRHAHQAKQEHEHRDQHLDEGNA